MKVTFDTNTLDKAARPERHPKDPNQSDYVRVHEALRTGRFKGYFSETLVTLEGIEKKDRVNVLGSTRLESQWRSNGESTITLSLTTQQNRNPPHPESSRRIQAAQNIGMRALRGPTRMVVSFRARDEAGTFFEPDGSTVELLQRMDMVNNVATEIEARGVGRMIALSLGLEFSARDGAFELWLQGLKRARDGDERRRIEKAVAEWADADSIASHIGYQMDLFCTNDCGKSAGAWSVFSRDNKAWLTATYGVGFVTIPELIQRL